MSIIDVEDSNNNDYFCQINGKKVQLYLIRGTVLNYQVYIDDMADKAVSMFFCIKYHHPDYTKCIVTSGQHLWGVDYNQSDSARASICGADKANADTTHIFTFVGAY